MRRKDRGIFVLPSIKNPLNATLRKFSSRSNKEKNKTQQGISQTKSSNFRFKKELPKLSKTLRGILDTLGLNESQVFKLYRNFQRISGNKSEITRSDFLKALDEEESHISQSLFKMTLKESDCIAFDAFVRICTCWCLYSREDILKFCFDCFDADASGFIDEDEFKALSYAVNKGSPVFPGNFTSALQMVDENGDGVIDFLEFKDLDKRFPLILFPVFRLQEKIQNITLGQRNWVEINKRVERGRQRQRTHELNIPHRTFLRGNKLPAIYPDPERIDALKKGEVLDR